MQKLTLPPAGDLPQRGLFDLAGPVGREAANDRDDVIRAQLMLGAAGYLDPGRLPGPTGWPGDGLVRAIRAWQKDNGLTVDGVLMPEGWNGDPRNGETLRSLKTRHGEALTDMPVPTAAEVDARFERRKENNMAQRNALSIIVTRILCFYIGVCIRAVLLPVRQPRYHNCSGVMPEHCFVRSRSDADRTQSADLEVSSIKTGTAGTVRKERDSMGRATHCNV